MARKTNLVADAFAATSVLAWRLPMLWAMALNPTPRRRTEALRMVMEKSAAAAEAIVAAQAEVMLSLLNPARKTSMNKIVNAACTPARRRVTANAKRLHRRRHI